MSADFAEITVEFEYDNVVHELEVVTVVRDAHLAAQAFIEALEEEEWSDAWDLLEPSLRAQWSETEFASDMEGAFGSGNAIVSYPIDPGVWLYLGEPGTGARTAAGWITLTASSTAGTETSLLLMAMVYTESGWKLITLDDEDLVRVSGSGANGWGFLQETATAIGALVSGPGNPPSGSGSARITLGSTGGGIWGTLAFAGTPLSAIEAVRYSTFQPSESPGTVQTIALQFDMDYDLTDMNTSWQGRLVYEPYFTETVQKGTWQTWDPLAGKWWATGSPGKSECPQSTPCTWAEVLAAFPDAGIRVNGGLSLKAGSGWPADWQGNVDALIVVTSVDTFAFDFEE